MSEIVIRRLSGSDSLDELTELLHRGYARLAQMGLRFTATYQSAEITRERADQGECYVALAGERIVGTICFRAVGVTCGCEWYDRPEVASFGQFAVEPELQGCGIGRRLLDLAERRAAETGAAELALDTAEPAQHLIDLYARWGYRPVGHAQWESTNYRSLIMSKTIRLD